MYKKMGSITFILSVLLSAFAILYPLGQQMALAQGTYYQTNVDKVVIKRFQQNLEQQISEFTKGVPESIKNITLIHIEGFPSLLQKTRVIQKLLLTLHKLERFEIIDCPECQKQVAYTKGGKLFFAPLIDSSEQFQNLKQTQKIDAYLKGLLEYDPEAKKLVLLLQLFQTEDGRLIKLGTINSDKRKRRFEKIWSKSNLEWSLTFLPYTIGFAASSGDQEVTAYTGGGLRVVSGPLFFDTGVGIDFDAIIPTPSSEFEEVPTVLMFLPLLQYHGPWIWGKKRFFKGTLGYGSATIGDQVITVNKLGTDVSISSQISVGVDYYSFPEATYQASSQEVTFAGPGIALHARFIF